MSFGHETACSPVEDEDVEIVLPQEIDETPAGGHQKCVTTCAGTVEQQHRASLSAVRAGAAERQIESIACHHRRKIDDRRGDAHRSPLTDKPASGGFAGCGSKRFLRWSSSGMYTRWNEPKKKATNRLKVQAMRAGSEVPVTFML